MCEYLFFTFFIHLPTKCPFNKNPHRTLSVSKILETNQQRHNLLTKKKNFNMTLGKVYQKNEENHPLNNQIN
jgi:hypothetical protein